MQVSPICMLFNFMAGRKHHNLIHIHSVLFIKVSLIYRLTFYSKTHPE